MCTDENLGNFDEVTDEVLLEELQTWKNFGTDNSEIGWDRAKKSPSDRQVGFAELISETLEIDFPTMDSQYTAQEFMKFISSNINEFNIVKKAGKKE